MAETLKLLQPALFMAQHLPLYNSVDWLNADYSAYYQKQSEKAFSSNIVRDLSLVASEPFANITKTFGKNTHVTYASSSTLISGIAHVYYDRLDIGAAFAAEGISPSLLPKGLTSWTDVLTALCEKYSVVLPADAAPLTPFPANIESLSSIELALNDSQCYTLTGTLVIEIEIPSLASVVTQTSLPGLIGPGL